MSDEDEWIPEEPETRVASLPGTFRLTELGNAERLVAHWRDRLRYSHQRRNWLLWDGRRWRWDETAAIERMAKRTVRQIYVEALDAPQDLAKELRAWAGRSEQRKQIQAMVGLASSEEGVPILMPQLDADPWLLNCANGTVNLRDGALRDHSRADYITRCTDVEYMPGVRHDLWESVLRDMTGDDAELAQYLQRVAGYALIGTPLERVFFFLFGPPGTAKSTFVEALHIAMGDYAQDAAFDTWIQQPNRSANRGDLVRIAGSRLVTSVEVQPGTRWDEALIKRITGGDLITAAAKYENEVTFRPSCSLLFAANDAPSAREDDDGFWQRMRRIPLTARIAEERQDRQLKTKLRQPEVARAILSWAVLGCIAYQRDGFGKSAAVESSTQEYRSELDHFSEFLADCMVFEEGARITRAALRKRYEAWAEEVNRKSLLDARKIAEKLKRLRCQETIVMGNRTWVGVREKTTTD